MIEIVMKLIELATDAAIRILRSDEALGESDRLILAKQAELAAELLERKKFG